MTSHTFVLFTEIPDGFNGEAYVSSATVCQVTPPINLQLTSNPPTYYQQNIRKNFKILFLLTHLYLTVPAGQNPQQHPHQQLIRHFHKFQTIIVI